MIRSTEILKVYQNSFEYFHIEFSPSVFLYEMTLFTTGQSSAFRLGSQIRVVALFVILDNILIRFP